MRLLRTVLLFFVLANVDAFDITAHPKDVTQDEGKSAFFPCTYTGTNDLPWWSINNTSYSVTKLPFGFYTNGSGLVVSSYCYLNNTAVYCYFVRYHSTTRRNYIHQSRVGTLTVRQNGGNNGFPDQEPETCKPIQIFIEVSGVGTTTVQLKFSWLQNESPGCRGVSYLAELAKCPDADESEMPVTICEITTNKTYILINNESCPYIPNTQSLFFRVKHKDCEQPSRGICHIPCYTSYQKIQNLSDTENITAVKDEPLRYRVSSSPCDQSLEICATKPNIFPQGVCEHKDDPGNLNFTSVGGVSEIQFSEVHEDMDDALFMLICQRQTTDCSKTCAVDTVINTFRLAVINGTKGSDDEKQDDVAIITGVVLTGVVAVVGITVCTCIAVCFYMRITKKPVSDTEEPPTREQCSDTEEPPTREQCSDTQDPQWRELELANEPVRRNNIVYLERVA